MADWVQNVIEFAATKEDAEAVFAVVSTEGRFDFRTLVPPPLHILQYGDLGKEEDDDFGVANTWYGWNNANWGTKWNAAETDMRWKGGFASIAFSTAWSVPYPVVVAFGNKFKRDFTLRYIGVEDEEWGVEEYKVNKMGYIERKSKRLPSRTPCNEKCRTENGSTDKTEGSTQGGHT